MLCGVLYAMAVVYESKSSVTGIAGSFASDGCGYVGTRPG
jgi:hypothetical protein